MSIRARTFPERTTDLLEIIAGCHSTAGDPVVGCPREIWSTCAADNLPYDEPGRGEHKADGTGNAVLEGKVLTWVHPASFVALISVLSTAFRCAHPGR